MMSSANFRPEPSDLERLFRYMRDFEIAYLTGDFAVIERHFHEDAIHEIGGGGAPIGSGGVGRAAIIAGLRAGVDAVDRRFDARIPEILEGPQMRSDGIWMRFALRLRRAGLPELCIHGEHLAEYRGGRIAGLRERVADGEPARVAAYLAEHHARLRAAGSPFAPITSAADMEALDAATGRSLVRCYGAAKSEQDTDAALTVCSDGFSIDTVAFGIASRDREETRLHLQSFFLAFPDYAVTLEGFATSPGIVSCWGTARLTFGGDFLGHRATGRTAELPIFCVFETAAGTLASERFFFDLAALCEQIEVPVAALQSGLRTLREAAVAA